MTHSFISNPFQPVNGKTILLLLHGFFRLIYLNSFFFLLFFFFGVGGGLQTLDSSKKRTGVSYSLGRFAPISSTRAVGGDASTSGILGTEKVKIQ